jgi:hypothetical protein
MNYDRVLEIYEIKTMTVEELLDEYADSYLEMKTTFKFNEKSCSEVMRNIRKELEFRCIF